MFCNSVTWTSQCWTKPIWPCKGQPFSFRTFSQKQKKNLSWSLWGNVESIFLPPPVKQFIRENKLYLFSSRADGEKTNIWNKKMDGSIEQAVADQCQAQTKLSVIYWLKCFTEFSLSSIKVKLHQRSLWLRSSYWGNFLLRSASILSQPNSTLTQVGSDKVISWTTTHPTPPTYPDQSNF